MQPPSHLFEPIQSPLRADAEQIIREAIAAAQPRQAVERALAQAKLPPKVHLIAVGKAAWPMADAAWGLLEGRIAGGMVITKYGHSQGPIGSLRIWEAGHPVPDAQSFAATRAAMEWVRPLTREDCVVFLLSGGGSALFESPLIPQEELESVTRQLLACGADIVEMNTLRKRFSAVKGGRFAQLCAPARVFAVVLSDIVGDPLDMIASGPTVPDGSGCQDALEIVRRYGLSLSESALAHLRIETPKQLDNAESVITGSVRTLCDSAFATCGRLGYRPLMLTAGLTCAARDAGSFLASIARHHAGTTESLAFIAGGETVVRVTGEGLGGRNQELALAAALGIAGLRDTAVFSVGSDGTDGPTDAAGGFVDGGTLAALEGLRISPREALQDNDSYHALKACGGLIVTGPTGTNVNDLSVALIRR